MLSAFQTYQLCGRVPKVIGAVLALAFVGTADARLLSASVYDFSFQQGRVVYTTPSLDKASMEVTAENRIMLVEGERRGHRVNARNRRVDILRQLQLGLGPANPSGETEGSFLLFGTLTDGEMASTTELVAQSQDAVQASESMGYLMTGLGVTDGEALALQGVGVCECVAGMDCDQWIEQCTKMGSAPAGIRPTVLNTANAIPTPATALLVFAGLLGLRYLSGRRNGSVIARWRPA